MIQKPSFRSSIDQGSWSGVVCLRGCPASTNVTKNGPSSIEILRYKSDHFANRLQNPLEVIFANETFVDADNRRFFALGVRTNIGKGVFRSNLLTHRYTLRNADNQILVTAVRRNRGCLRGRLDKMRPGESQYLLRCLLRHQYQNHSCKLNTSV